MQALAAEHSGYAGTGKAGRLTYVGGKARTLYLNRLESGSGGACAPKRQARSLFNLYRMSRRDMHCSSKISVQR
jgi:hypothetical protein